MSSIMPPVPFKSPMVDRDGTVSAVWADFFKQILHRSGGKIGLTNHELSSLFPVALGSLSVDVQNSLVPSGVVLPYGGSTAPAGYLLCDGSAVSRTVYSSLFSAIGTTFGNGNGSTTFNIPNPQGAFMRFAGTQVIGGITYSATLGAVQGDQMQGHKHSATTTAAIDSGAGGGGGIDGLAAPGATVTVGSPTTDGTNGTPRVGSETRPANLGMNGIIKI